MRNSEFDIVNVVVVRFSLRVDAWKRRMFFNEYGREPWFRYRAMLYRNTLGPSIKAQTVKPVRIYLLMDDGDRALAQQYLTGIDHTPIFASSGNQHELVARDLEIEGLTNNVAMSRIDSDDIVERRYFEKLNRRICGLLNEGHCPELIAACRGYRSNFSQIQPMYYHNGPFITRFCRRYGGESPYFHHKTIEQYVHVKDNESEWMQVIHGTNVANGFQPSTAVSLEQFMSGECGTASLAKVPIDPAWFREWAGFEMPAPALFQQAPVTSLRARFRRILRELRGKA